MSADLWAALCLVAVLEGLLLFAAPGAWKRMAERLQELPERNLRLYGGGMVLFGLIALQFVR